MKLVFDIGILWLWCSNEMWLSGCYLNTFYSVLTIFYFYMITLIIFIIIVIIAIITVVIIIFIIFIAIIISPFLMVLTFVVLVFISIFISIKYFQILNIWRGWRLFKVCNKDAEAICISDAFFGVFDGNFEQFWRSSFEVSLLYFEHDN